MAFCEFKKMDSSQAASLWRCDRCAYVTTKPFEKQPKRTCPLAKYQEEKTKGDSSKRVSDHREISPELAYLRCPHRRQVIATIDARTAGCGCSSTPVEVYQCRHFNEPVLKAAADRCRDKIAANVKGYTGRTCRECDVPMGKPKLKKPNGKPRTLPYSPDNLLGLPDGCLTNVDTGIITGGSAVHWPCLGALAISAHQHGYGFAVADHGLADWQRAELKRCGALFIEHAKPKIDRSLDKYPIVSHANAYWKPWVCRESPFEISFWIDSDAAVVGALEDLIPLCAGRCAISDQQLWHKAMILYRDLIDATHGKGAYDRVKDTVANINTGVLAWRRGDPLIDEWCEVTARILPDARLRDFCRVRDQSTMAIVLADRMLTGRDGYVMMEPRFNMPADNFGHKDSSGRRPIDLRPTRLLAEASRRHPGAAVVHWLGRPKPWEIGK